MGNEFVQGSPEWLEMRKSKIGASDSPIILGVSPYPNRTALALWKEKTGRCEPPHINQAMQRGHDLEPMIRDRYEQQIDDSFLPSVVTHPEHDYLIASLDGLNFNGDKLLEIKCCNKEVFNQAKNGVVVPHYYTQIQHQLSCVPQATECHYVCYHSGDMASVIVYPDHDHQQRLLEAAKEFYQCMVDDVPPAHSEHDYVEIQNEEAEANLHLYMDYRDAQSEAKKKADALKPLIINETDDGNCYCGPFKITKSYMKGSVDMKKLCEELGISEEMLESFRKPDAIRWTISRKK